MTRRKLFQWSKATLALVMVGSIIAAQLVLVGVLALTGHEIPSELWDTIRMTISALVGVAGAQMLNGRAAQDKG